MYEIKLVGRAGQGVVTAANIIVYAAVVEGKFGCALPHFGFEREGAPVVSYVRISNKKIRKKTRVYKPDCVVVFDENLLDLPDVLHHLKNGGTLIVNSTKTPAALNLSNTSKIKKLGIVDASGLALRYLGRPILSSPMLGAFAATTKIVRVESIVNRIQQLFGTKNSELVVEGYESTKIIEV